jgi:ribosomal protein S18 acetylase RimI-like enzyme
VALQLRELTETEVVAFAAGSFESYLRDRVTSGEDDAAVAAESEGQFEAMFPYGKARPGHLLWRLEENAQPVGTLWIGPVSPEDALTYWVWDIVIDETHRGRGLGREAMQLAEERARAAGATTLGLTVFAHNPVAWHLYEQLGYASISTRMSKVL